MLPFESLPYRPCAGMLVLNRAGLVFIGRRTDGPEHVDATHVWQMPQGGIDEDEEIIQQCIEVIRSEQKASVSLLQRRLRLGYGRAARIMDELENRGIVGPSKGAEPRDILIDLDAPAFRSRRPRT